jgi:hypothetical protein
MYLFYNIVFNEEISTDLNVKLFDYFYLNESLIIDDEKVDNICSIVKNMYNVIIKI